MILSTLKMSCESDREHIKPTGGDITHPQNHHILQHAPLWHAAAYILNLLPHVSRSDMDQTKGFWSVWF